MKYKNHVAIVLTCVWWLVASMIIPMFFIGKHFNANTVLFLSANIGLAFICTIFFAFVIKTKE